MASPLADMEMVGMFEFSETATLAKYTDRAASPSPLPCKHQRGHFLSAPRLGLFLCSIDTVMIHEWKEALSAPRVYCRFEITPKSSMNIVNLPESTSVSVRLKFKAPKFQL